MTALQDGLYQALRGRLAGELVRSGQRDLVRLGQCVLHLVQAAVNPALLSETPDLPAAASFSPVAAIPALPGELLDALREYDRLETPWKYRRLALLLEERAAKGRKVIVWSSFPDNLERLRILLARYSPAVIHGRVPSRQARPRAALTRDRELARFREDKSCRVLLANPAATGEGISLHHACHDAVYMDRTFNAVHYLQSVDRIHRLGMAADQETTITFLISAGTLDEAVANRLQEKAERLGQVLEDPHSIGMILPRQEDEVAGLGYPHEEDLAALFEHLRTIMPN
jgi:SNF2 family DNA or RNA helicase